MIAMLLAAAALAVPQDPVDLTLENGLRVHLLPIDEGEYTVLLVGLAAGEREDPESAAGMAHYLEHLALTAGVGDRPARPFEQMQTEYAGMVNGQTLWDHVVLTWAFDSSQTRGELERLALTLHDLRVEQADVDREIPRLELELSNMYGWWPGLAGPNTLQTRMRHGGAGPRRGGEIDQLRKLEPRELSERWRTVTDPRRVVVAVAGPIDVEEVSRWMQQHLGSLAVPAGAPARPSKPHTKPFEAATIAAATNQTVAIAGFAPLSDSPEDFADFYAVAMGLLLARNSAIPVQYSALEDPYWFSAYSLGDDAEQSLHAWLDEVAATGIEPRQLFSIKMTWGGQRGVWTPQRRMMAAKDFQSLYAVAYARTLRTIRGDAAYWAAADKRMRELDAGRVKKAAAAILAPERRQRLLVKPL